MASLQSRRPATLQRSAARPNGRDPHDVGPNNISAPRVKASLAHRSRASLKTAIRRVSRRAGYDLVPLQAGMSAARIAAFASVSTLLDVGANVGQYAERVRDEGYTGAVVSFEPGSAAFSILERKAGRAPRWQVRRLALGSEPGTATLHVSGNSVSSSLLDVGEEHLRAAPGSAVVDEEQVRVSTLDDETRDLAAPFFLKIDVQGYELAVLEAATETLARTHAVQIEVSFTELYQGETRWTTLVDRLQGHGFQVHYLEPGYEDAATGRMLQCDVLLLRATA